MRQITLAASFALALAAMFSWSPAKAEFGGAVEQNGQCRQFNPYNPNHQFYYWGPCPGHEAGHGRPTRIIKVTNGGVGSGIGREHTAHHHKG
jgi:hypothetical protein